MILKPNTPIALCLVILSVLTFSCQQVDESRPTTQNDTLNKWIQNADWYYSSKIDTTIVDTIRVEMIVNPESDSSIITSAMDIAVVDNMLLVADYLGSKVVAVHLQESDSVFIVREKGEGFNETMYPNSITKCDGNLTISMHGFTTTASLTPPFEESRRYAGAGVRTNLECFENAIIMSCPVPTDPEGAICIYDFSDDGEQSLRVQFLPNIIPFPMQPSVYNTSILYADQKNFYYAYTFIPFVLIGNSDGLDPQNTPISGVLHLDHPGYSADLMNLHPIPSKTETVDMSMPSVPFIQFVYKYEDHLLIAIRNKLFVFEVDGTAFIFKKVNVFVNDEQRHLVTWRMDIYKDSAIITSGRRGEIYSVDLDQIVGPAK